MFNGLKRLKQLIIKCWDAVIDFEEIFDPSMIIEFECYKMKDT
jgi:hypothetical protein